MSDLPPEVLCGIRLQFCEEALEGVDRWEGLVLTFEKDPSPPVISSIKSVLHNIKGSSRGVGFDRLSEIVHQLESDLIKAPIQSTLIDQMLLAIDDIRVFLKQVKAAEGAVEAGDPSLDRLYRLVKG